MPELGLVDSVPVPRIPVAQFGYPAESETRKAVSFGVPVAVRTNTVMSMNRIAPENGLVGATKEKASYTAFVTVTVTVPAAGRNPIIWAMDGWNNFKTAPLDANSVIRVAITSLAALMSIYLVPAKVIVNMVADPTVTLESSTSTI